MTEDEPFGILILLILMLSVCADNHSKFLGCENYFNKAILILILIVILILILIDQRVLRRHLADTTIITTRSGLGVCATVRACVRVCACVCVMCVYVFRLSSPIQTGYRLFISQTLLSKATYK